MNNSSTTTEGFGNGDALADILDQPYLVTRLWGIWESKAVLPLMVAGTYLHNTETKLTICKFNSRYFNATTGLCPIAPTAPIWAKMLKFHSEVVAGDILPSEGSHLIYNHWLLADCFLTEDNKAIPGNDVVALSDTVTIVQF